jgi:hypothetical protein
MLRFDIEARRSPQVRINGKSGSQVGFAAFDATEEVCRSPQVRINRNTSV